MKRFSVRRISSCSWVICIGLSLGVRRSRAGDAELHRLECAPPRLVADGEAEREHAARVARVDQAVVEQRPEV